MAGASEWRTQCELSKWELQSILAKLEQGNDVVSGLRNHRVDNLVLRKIPSRCANWLMAKLSGVNIHDFGTTFKAYRRELLSQLPLYGEMHRFIPALASAYGAPICEIPIQNKHRKYPFQPFFSVMGCRRSERRYWQSSGKSSADMSASP